MNISNTSPYDITYSNRAVSEESEVTKTQKPAIKTTTNDSFYNRVKNIYKAENREESNLKEQLDELENLIDKSNRDFKIYDKKFDISVHEATNELLIKIVDTNTDEVIREIPPEKVLDTIAIRREILGMMMDLQI